MFNATSKPRRRLLASGGMFWKNAEVVEMIARSNILEWKDQDRKFSEFLTIFSKVLKGMFCRCILYMHCMYV